MSAWASGKKRAKKSSRYSSRASFQGLSKSIGVFASAVLPLALFPDADYSPVADVAFLKYSHPGSGCLYCAPVLQGL